MINLYTWKTTEKRIYMKKLLLALVAVLMLVGCSAKTAEEPAGTEESETVKEDVYKGASRIDIPTFLQR